MIFHSQYRTAVLLKNITLVFYNCDFKKNACYIQPNDSLEWEHVINLTGSVEQSLWTLLKQFVNLIDSRIKA